MERTEILLEIGRLRRKLWLNNLKAELLPELIKWRSKKSHDILRKLQEQSVRVIFDHYQDLYADQELADIIHTIGYDVFLAGIKEEHHDLLEFIIGQNTVENKIDSEQTKVKVYYKNKEGGSQAMSRGNMLSSLIVPFEKIGDALKVVIDATFGWSINLQKERLKRIKTTTQEDILQTKAEIEREKLILENQLKDEEHRRQLEIQQVTDTAKRAAMMLEHEIWQESIKFRVNVVTELTGIVSDLQNEHCRKIMALLTDYKMQQIDAIKELEDDNRENINQITEEAKEYKENFPEIYMIKLEQMRSAIQRHHHLVMELTNGMRKDIDTIKAWLLDATRFNAEDFILKIAGTDSKEGFKKYLEQKGISLEQLSAEQ